MPNQVKQVIDLQEQYDKCIVNYVSESIATGLLEDAQVVFATQKGDYIDVHNKRVVHGDKLTLPRISIQLISDEFNPERAHVGKYRKVAIPTGDDENNPKSYYSALHPVPYILQYTVTLWSHRQSQINWFKSKFRLEFGNYWNKLFSVYAGDVWKHWTWSLFLDDLQDESEIESGDKYQQLRYSANLRAEVFFFHDVTETKTIKRIHLEYIDKDDTDISYGIQDITEN